MNPVLSGQKVCEEMAKLGPRRLFRLLVVSLKRELGRRLLRSFGTLALKLNPPKAPELIVAKVSSTSSRQSLGNSPQNLSLLNDWFDKVVVLTIPRNEERMSQTKRELSGLDYEICLGIDQRDYSHVELRRMLKELRSYAEEDASPATMAHSISLLRLMHDMIARGTKRLLFLEDDVRWAPYARSILEKARSELAGEPIDGAWDVIHFHSHLPCTPPDLRTSWPGKNLYYPKIPDCLDDGQLTWDQWVVESKENPERILSFHGGRQYIRNTNGGFLQMVYKGHKERLSSVCIGISLEGARKIIESSVIWQPSDRMIGSLSSVENHRVYVVSPFPAHPRPVATSFDYD